MSFIDLISSIPYKIRKTINKIYNFYTNSEISLSRTYQYEIEDLIHASVSYNNTELYLDLDKVKNALSRMDKCKRQLMNEVEDIFTIRMEFKNFQGFLYTKYFVFGEDGFLFSELDVDNTFKYWCYIGNDEFTLTEFELYSYIISKINETNID